MINPIRNQKGIALVVTLMMLVLGFAVVAILLRLSTQETKLTRLEQGYTTALDAAKAGADLFMGQVENSQSMFNQTLLPITGFGTINAPCLTIKMWKPTSSWTSTTGWGAGCPTLANATSAFPSDPTDITNVTGYYNDMTMPLPNNYTVYVKVIDNYKTAATSCSPAPCPCSLGCYYYTVLSRAQAPGSSEHADVQFVYRFDAQQ